MNRRESLKALAIGSAGAAAPFVAWENVPFTKKGNEIVSDGSGKSHLPSETFVQVAGDYNSIHVVASQQLLALLKDSFPPGVKAVPRESLNEQELVTALASGEAMVWIGSPEGIPKELSVGAFRVSDSKVSVNVCESSPLFLPETSFGGAAVYSAFIAPPKEMPNHNVDEEVRADFLPILEARDRFGNVTGYPGLLMSYYASSLAKRRFKGSECFFFLFDDAVASVHAFKNIIAAISSRRNSGLMVNTFDTGFASYKPGERVQVRTRLLNLRNAAVTAMLKYSVRAPGEKDFMHLIELRRVPEGGSETEALFNFRPQSKPGLWTLRMQVLQDVVHAEQLPFDGNLAVTDQRDIGFLLIPEILTTPDIFSIKGASIEIDKAEGFIAGTHYYPSTSWWEWVWRDFRPLKAAEDFAAIRRAGYRIARVWIDPVIDETVLRAMDAAIQLASANGIVLDICVFTQWVRQMGFERDNGEHVLFDYRGKRDFNVVSFSLRNLDLQREFVQIIGGRWKNAGNIFYDLANEVYVKDPDASQMDKEASGWSGIPAENSVLRDSLLFRRWGNEMTAAIRKAGAKQPVVPGYMFSTAGGGDVYVGNADAPLVPWHSYAPTDQTGLTLSYFDPISSGRPILLEELGVLGWNNEKNYDGTAHYALGAGAAGAMSYEWGLSWLSRESCFWPLPLRDTIVDDPDPRWFPAYIGLFKSWPEKGVGMCPTPSGTGYGSVYHGTPFPAAAAVALGRMGLMGRGLQRVMKPEQVYVIVPSTQVEAMKAFNEVVKGLWSAKLVFGIWQEADLDKLPAGVLAVICPVALSSVSSLSAGIKVYEGTEAWKSAPELEKIMATPSEKFDLMTRRTAEGRLFMLVSKNYSGMAQLKFEGVTVSMGLSDFALAHITDRGVVLMEGEGKFGINNAVFCSVASGRVIVSSEDGEGLLKSKNIRLMVTGPAKISFNRKIISVRISDGFNDNSVAAGNYAISGKQLSVDDQLGKYVIHVGF